jgi:hypothetical protein
VSSTIHTWPGLTHVSSPDNTYDVLFNGESQRSGNLLEDFTPSVNPPKEIDDPEDTKPADWVDQKRISDPDAVKVYSLSQC